jgi:DNA (cytosine-5)-methyltransferase 1
MLAPLNSIELFTGAGGLALGVAKAGFLHDAVIEWNRDACCSLRENSGHLALMRDWPVYEQDVREYDFRKHAGTLTLIAAGAPCQPFSLAGKHRGHEDHRNMFPEVFRAVREALPPAVVIENVKGLLRASFRPYFDYIVAALSAPEMPAFLGEAWQDHKSRLEKVIASRCVPGTRYRVSHQLLNAADYGVPQRRERVFIIAIREDLNVRWKGLKPTHSEDALLFAKWCDGSYWREHDMEPLPMPSRLIPRVRRLRESIPELFPLKRWRTVRDALRGLPEPLDYVPHPTIVNHVGNPGARSYPGHTGSPWDEPAKTLKAGDHGVPGGENMLRREDGSVRYFTVREAARLQTFPDDYIFRGAWSEGFRQLGNAVPVDLGYAVAKEIRDMLRDQQLSATFPDLSSRALDRVA